MATIPIQYQDRMVTTQDAENLISESELKPVAITVTAQEVGVMFAAGASPYVFNQFLLERFKHTGGVPVEGVLKFTLREGSIARVKPQLGDQSGVFRYVWLPPEYVQAVSGEPVVGAGVVSGLAWFMVGWGSCTICASIFIHFRYDMPRRP